jgi:hypothetical protein
MVVQVSVIREADFAENMARVYSAKKLYDQAKTLYPDVKDVSGAGDSAFRSDNTLNVLSGEATFSVMVGLPGRANVADETLVGLAKVVESRID